MKYFEHECAATFEEASAILKDSEKGKAVVMAGGSDLVGVLKEHILEEYPEKVVNIKTIENGDYIREDGDAIEIGALTKLCDVVKSDVLNEKALVLSQAAHSVATPLIRNVATLGGNMCQDVRCWFYRYPHGVGGRLDCMRKGGEECYAIRGDNRYHSIFGGMKVHTTPCASECPANTDIPGYMAELRKGNWDGAAQIFMRYNPMPMITSRICPHVCQDGCNQCSHGDSVNIHGVERSLGDYILKNADRYYQAPKKETGKTVSVIGAGPGGLAAAYYLRKAGNSVVVYDRMDKAGGVLRYGIPHYRLPKSIVDDFVKALENMGIHFKMGTEVGKNITMEEIDESSDSIYIGTGAWKQPILGLEGESLTQFGLNFLVEVNTYLEKAIGNDVLVCGGGSVAMDVALTAMRLGAKNVKLVCLEKEHEMPASAEELERAKEEGVQMYPGWGLGKIVTDADGKVKGLEAKKCVSVFDENHRFSPVYDESERMTIDSDYIILATGQRVDIEFLGEAFTEQLKTARGLIDVDLESYKTKHAGIYAGGDVVTGPNIAIRAIRAGRVAAAGINKDFGIAALEAPEKEQFIHFDSESVKKTESNKLKELPVSERSLTKEDAASFDEETAIDEAGRCMNCGCYSVNASDISPVMVLLNADIITTKKTIRAADFFTTNLKAYDMLEQGELVKAVRFAVPKGFTTGYDKFRVRDAVDFAIVSLAYAYRMKGGKIEDVKLVLGGVAPVPLVKDDVAALLKGKTPDGELAEKAAELAVEGAVAMEHNSYKIQEVKALIKRLIINMK